MLLIVIIGAFILYRLSVYKEPVKDTVDSFNSGFPANQAGPEITEPEIALAPPVAPVTETPVSVSKINTIGGSFGGYVKTLAPESAFKSL